MADALEYVVNTALMHCDKGIAMLPFSATINTTVHIQKQLVGTEMDKAPLVNIPSFGMCSATKSPCTPVPTVWQETYEFVNVKGFKPLLFQSCMQCGAGGKIEFLTSGQLPLSDSVTPESLEQIEEANEQAEEAVAEYEAEKDAVGESGIVEGFIPVWGSGRDAVNAFQTGHWGWGIFHSVLVVVDVVTLGGGTVVKGIIKGGIKGGMKAAAKGLTKKAAAALAAKQTAVALMKKTGKEISEFSVKRLGICITKACFVAGTPVATKDGLKKIEDIQFRDEVWAYDEKTGEIGLKEVINVFERETNVLIELTLDSEKIKTTPEHPFYVNGEWKEAGLLETGDHIMLFSGRFVTIKHVAHEIVSRNKLISNKAGDDGSTIPDSNSDILLGETAKVYNFEVRDWHTYFVGCLQILVHNAVCIVQAIKRISDRLIKLGRTPGKGSATGKKVWERQLADGTARELPDGRKIFKDPTDKKWYDLKDADMGHYKESAVDYWNREGYKHGPKSDEVRKWMLDSDNYTLEYFRNNRSAGAKIKTPYK